MLTCSRPWPLLVALVLGIGTLPAQAADVDREGEGKTGDSRARQLRDKLAQHVSISGFEAGTPLKEALGFFSERFDLPLAVSPDLLKLDKDFDARPVKVGKLTGVRLRTMLALLLEQADAGVVQRDGVLLVVPREQALPARLLRHRVDVEFNKCPLNAALEQLADATGCTVVLDPRAGDKGKTPLTATFKDVPVETAVRVLADMAELKPVLLDNVLYVTTRANARVLQAEQAQRENAPAVMPKAQDAEPAAASREEKKP